MNNIKVSVIVPIYNVEDYLEECLQSIATQDLREIEVILVDDGSTDNSGKIADAFSKNDDRFRFYHKENSGAGASRNYGVTHAKGEYLSFVDSDDVIPSYALKKMYEVAKEEDADLVTGRVMRLKEDGYSTSRMFETVFSEYHHRTSLSDNRMLHFDVIVCSKLIRRTYWTENQVKYPENLSYCEDLPVAFKLFCDAKRIVMLDEIVYLWRLRKGESASITQKKSVKMVKDRLDALRLINQYTLQKNLSEEIIRGKRIKNLQNDLNLLLNKAVELDDDSLRKSMHLIAEYIKEDELENYFKYIPIMHEEKFRMAIEGDAEGIRKLRAFQLGKNSQIRSIKVGRKYIGVFPKDILRGRLADMKSSIDAELLRHSIQNVTLNSSEMIIEGCAFVRYLPVKNTKMVKMRAWLVDKRRSKIKEVNLTQKKTKKPASVEKRSNSNHINYDGTGYIIKISVDDVASLTIGEYRIALEWDSANQHREVIIGKMKQSLEESFTGKRFPGSNNITINTTLNREPILIVGE